MKKFNPERELSKIRNSNKKKALISICALLVVGVLGYSFALYQVRHTNKLVFNTVDEFIKKDIVVSVLIDNESKPEFPAKEDGYVYSDYECENDGVITFDSKNWEFTLKNNQPDKCVIKFSSDPFKANACKDLPMSECLLLEEVQYNKELIYDDPDANARYYGKNPTNYIWFNCDDYSNPTEETCERWRIIGSFKNTEKVNGDGTTESQNLVKIIRTEKLTQQLPYDSNNYLETESILQTANNDWTTSELMNILNGNNENHQIKINEEVESTTANNSLYWNRKAGYCSTWTNEMPSIIPCDFTAEGLKGNNDDPTKKMIETVKWKIGSIGSDRDVLTSAQWYQNERILNNVWGEDKSTWIGKIATFYPSDYAYSIEGIEEFNRNQCLKMSLYDWSFGDYRTKCINTGWMALSGAATITVSSASRSGIYRLTSSDWPRFSWGHFAGDIYPALYLTHDTKITGGDGTYENPYTIDTIK